LSLGQLAHSQSIKKTISKKNKNDSVILIKIINK